MNKIVILLVSFFLLFNFSHCKNDNKGDTGSTNSTSKQSDAKEDPLLIPVPTGYYKPEGLKPLNLIEMFKFGSEHPIVVRNLPLKDKNGNSVPNRIMENPEKPMFMQMYANDSGRVVLGVTYEMNDEIKGLIMKVRMVKSN